MKIAKTINNNVVSTCDEEGRRSSSWEEALASKAKEGSTH